ncbi:hypothetical protein [Falsiroseomonas oryziterrae]|uniref:hypothetical protein n=1 Tax=Falsiroseomonas oryziterrae TaxID=2911368 RepID=UPI001F157A97|nr:hypothetical protein [Roseomonas sp. NPKOSM-4]
MFRRSIRLGVLGALTLGTAQAQQPMATQPEPRPAATVQSAAPSPCDGPRAWLAAEETTPGILQRLARESLAQCLAGTPTPAPAAQGRQ